MNEDYTTKDFWLAAYILTTQAQIKSYKKTNGIVTFTFEGSAELGAAIDQFHAQKALVNPMAYAYAQRTLKNIIHDAANHMEKLTDVQQLQNKK